jgi:uroporphyrinogen decarboxylase
LRLCCSCFSDGNGVNPNHGNEFAFIPGFSLASSFMASAEITGRARLQNALAGRRLDRAPIWFMRQAGRYLPEYRALKEKYSFVEMVRTPELACEVTLQPLRRFPLDAAIIFSDILVIPEALGQGYGFHAEGGIRMDYRLEGRGDFEKLSLDGVEDNLAYVAGALRLTRQKLDPRTALLGFAGSPWTLGCYMVEGGSGDPFIRIKHWFYSQPDLFNELMELLTAAVIRYLKMQIASGVDAVQIFDSWAAACPAEDYEAMSLKWIRKIREALPSDFPLILYAKGVAAQFPRLAATGVACLSCDWTVSLPEVASSPWAPACLQGNLDPALLNGEPGPVRQVSRRLLESMKDHPGYVFNLGHGIYPQARLESVVAMVETVAGQSLA